VNQLDVVGVRVELPSNQPIVLLREVGGERYLPIWIGAVEATAIAYAQRGEVPPRPLTHDLFKDVITALGHELRQVRITDLRSDEVLDEAGIAIPDEQEDEVEKFREFLEQITPEDFGRGH
jgi:uncharacterized protein